MLLATLFHQRLYLKGRRVFKIFSFPNGSVITMTDSGRMNEKWVQFLDAQLVLLKVANVVWRVKPYNLRKHI